MKAECAIRSSVAICSARTAAAARGHQHLLIPREERAGLLEIVDLRQALLQVRVRRIHARRTVTRIARREMRSDL